MLDLSAPIAPSVYLVTTDVDATNSLGLGVPHNMTFPLTSPA